MRLYFGLAVILLSSVCSSSEICKEDTMKNCLTTLETFMEKEYLIFRGTEDKLNEYCVKFKRDGDCLKNVTEVCQEKHRRKAALSAALYNHLNHQCSSKKENLKTYTNALPCFDSHESDFEKCTTQNISKTQEDIQLTLVCLGMNFRLCIANTVRKLCGIDGKAAAESLEYGLKDSYFKFCNGIGPFKFDCWIILLSIIILLMMKQY